MVCQNLFWGGRTFLTIYRNVQLEHRRPTNYNKRDGKALTNSLTNNKTSIKDMFSNRNRARWQTYSHGPFNENSLNKKSAMDEGDIIYMEHNTIRGLLVGKPFENEALYNQQLECSLFERTKQRTCLECIT